jgi:hypothetical protein
MGWARFWAIFSQTHLVTLLGSLKKWLASLKDRNKRQRQKISSGFRNGAGFCVTRLSGETKKSL